MTERLMNIMRGAIEGDVVQESDAGYERLFEVLRRCQPCVRVLNCS